MSLKKCKESLPFKAVGCLTTYSVHRKISVGIVSHRVIGSDQLVLTPTDIEPSRVLLSDELNHLYLLDNKLLLHAMLLSMSIRRIYGNPKPDQYDQEVRHLQLQAAIADRAIKPCSPVTSFNGYAAVNSLPSEVFRGLKDRVDVLSCTSNGKYWKLTRSQDRLLF